MSKVGPATVTGTSERSAEWAMIVLALIWGVNFSVIKTALEGVSPLAFNALRFPLASLVLLAVLSATGQLGLPRRTDMVRIVALGLLGNVGYQLFFIYGIDGTLAGNASLLLATTPVWTALLSGWAGHERVTHRVWAGVLASLAGILLVTLSGGGKVGFDPATVRGDLLMIASSLIWATYTVGGRPLVAHYGSIAVTAWTLWVGTAGLVLIGLPSVSNVDFRSVAFGTWLAIGYAGMLGIGVAYLIWYVGVRRLGSARTAVFGNFVPVVALLVAWVWLGERPSIGQIVGAGLILGGIAVARSNRAKVPGPNLPAEV
jgi:drug/metabolite transporter (DMT)-like permease